MKRDVRVTLLAIAACVCLVGSAALAQTSVFDALDVQAIKSIRLGAVDSDYTAEILVLFVNEGENPIKLKDLDFNVRFKDGETVISLGKAPLAEIVIPGRGEDGHPGIVEAKLNMTIGPKNEETFGLMIRLFNIVGNPENTLAMMLDGTGEVGTKTKRGWVYQTGLRAELEFRPTIQREVLFD